MRNWATWARWGLACGGIAFAVALYRDIRPRGQEEEGVAPVATLDARAEVEVTNAVSGRWAGELEEFSIEAERQLNYQGGELKLYGVTVRIDDREEQRLLVITGKEGDVAASQDFLQLQGDVALTSTDDLSLQTQGATYSRSEGIVRAPGPGSFTDTQVAGHGQDLTYDRNTDVLQVQHAAEVTIGGTRSAADRIDVTSEAFRLTRQQGLFQFDGGVHMLRESQRILARSAVAQFADGGSGLESLDLDGEARIESTQAAGAEGGLESMWGDAIHVTYAPGGALDRVLLSGAASVVLVGEGGGGRRIAADVLDLTMDALGETVALVTGDGHVRLEFTGAEEGGRLVTANRLASDGSDRGLSRVRLSGDVDFRESTGQGMRTVRAERLDLNVGAGFGEVSEATFTGGVVFLSEGVEVTSEAAALDVDADMVDFSGGVRFQHDEVTASAPSAHQTLETGLLELFGTPAQMPTVSTRNLRIDAASVELVVDPVRVMATGGVKSYLLAAADSAAAEPGADDAGAAEGPKRPGFLDDQRAVTVTADALEYTDDDRAIVYTGQVRMWQDQSILGADTLTLEGESGDVRAEGHVQSTLPLQEGEGEKPMATSARASAFRYDEQTRRLLYDGDARVVGPQGTLSSDRIELVLANGESRLERLEGYSEVKLQESGRTTTGDRLTYRAATGGYQITGDPVTILEGCRESTGRSVTLYRESDRLIIDGRQSSRTRTANGDACD